MSKTQIPTGGIADDAISEEHIDAWKARIKKIKDDNPKE